MDSALPAAVPRRLRRARPDTPVTRPACPARQLRADGGTRGLAEVRDRGVAAATPAFEPGSGWDGRATVQKRAAYLGAGHGKDLGLSPGRQGVFESAASLGCQGRSGNFVNCGRASVNGHTRRRHLHDHRDCAGQGESKGSGGRTLARTLPCPARWQRHADGPAQRRHRTVRWRLPDSCGGRSIPLRPDLPAGWRPSQRGTSRRRPLR